MNNNDIEKLRPLANNTRHLIEIILEKMIKVANDAGHEMSDNFKEINNFYKSGTVYSYCKNCTYEIEIEFFDTNSKKERIYVKENMALEEKCRK
jgi:hypothetical protein